MATFIFQIFRYLQNSILPFKMPLIIIILFTVIVASYTSNGQSAQETNEQYLITGKIIERKWLTGSPHPPEIISSNEYGGEIMVYVSPTFFQIELKDYKMYRLEHRLVGRIFFSTNIPATNIVVIVKDLLDDTNPDEKPCIVFAEPYSLPEDVIQKYNLQGAMILQVNGGIFKEGARYDSILQKYGIKPEVPLQAQVRLKPEALEVSPGILTAFIRLPADYPVSGITSATCDYAPAERMTLNKDKTEMIIKFRRKDIEAAVGQKGEILDTYFVVRGTWQGAAGTYPFQGTASIKKIVAP